jgi:hypothetical protein
VLDLSEQTSEILYSTWKTRLLPSLGLQIPHIVGQVFENATSNRFENFILWQLVQ